MAFLGRLILPLLGTAVFFVLSLATIRFLRPREPRRFFLAYAALLLGASAWLCVRRWPLVRPDDALGLVACLLIQMLLCLTIWNTFYSLLWGFSGGLCHDLSQDERLQHVDRLIKSYEGDGDLDRILARRLPNLLRGGYVERRGQALRLLAKGRLLAMATRAAFKTFSLGMGGGIK